MFRLYITKDKWTNKKDKLLSWNLTLGQALKSQRYSSILSLTSATDWGVINTTSRPLEPQENSPNPLYRRLGGPQGRSGRVRKISPPQKFYPWTTQPVASRYTDCAIAVQKILSYSIRIWGRGKGPRAGCYKNAELLACCNTGRLIIPANLLHRPLCDSWKDHVTQLRHNQPEPPSLRVCRLPNARPRAKSTAAHTVLFSDARPGSSKPFTYFTVAVMLHRRLHPLGTE